MPKIIQHDFLSVKQINKKFLWVIGYEFWVVGYDV